MLLRQICFKVCRVEFGLILMFQAFQEECIRLLMTTITALHVSYICTCIYSLTKETKQKKYTMVMLKQHYDHYNIK